MTTYNITLGQDLIIHSPGFGPNDQVVVNSHGNGNALGNTLVTIPQTSQETLAQFIQFVEGLGPLEKGHTYVGTTSSDSDYTGEVAATFILTDTQSGKIGAISLLGIAPGFNLSEHVLTFGA
jgi:hypothetical protein